MKKLYLIENRPPDLPDAWIICNAPRPIMGTTTWRAEFKHGIFYAAIDPENEFSAMNLRDNENLDAWELIFFTMDQAKEKIRDHYPQYAAKIETLGERQIRETFSHIMNK